jgi:ligand-binding SRPBCC domain-containing protein
VGGVRQGSFSVSSRLAAPADAVWRRVTTGPGINAELMPIVRMTVPRGLESLDLDTVRDGQHLGRSWLLLGGVLPFDYDDITIERVEPGRAFQEDSTMFSQRSWRHHRVVEPDGPDRCTVTDQVTFRPRLPVPVRALEALFRQVFAHRHRRLRRRFGAP